MQKLFTIKHYIGETLNHTIVNKDTLSLGRSYKNDIISASSDFLPQEHTFLKIKGGEVSLFILKGMTGSMTNAGATISIDDLIRLNMLEKSDGGYRLKVPNGAEGHIIVGENRLEFGFFSKEKKKSPLKIKHVYKGLYKPLLDKTRSSLFLFLFFSAVIHAVSVHYVNSLKPLVKKKNEVTLAPQRFAKFILKPPPKKERAIVKKIIKIKDRKKMEEKKKVVPPKKKKIKKKEPEKKVEKKAEDKKIQAKKVPPKTVKKRRSARKRPQLTNRRKKIREKIKTRALLGVFTSKAVEKKSEEIFSDIDSFLGSVKEGKETPVSGEVTSFETLSDGFDEFSSEDGAIEEYQQTIKRDGTDDRIKLAEREKVKVEEAEDSDLFKFTREDSKLRSKGSIDKVVRTYIGGLKFLYNRELRKDNSLRGKLKVKFTISPEGKVIKIELVETTFKSEKLVKQMLKRIKKWKFPPEDVENTTTIYPFVFMPVG